MTIVVYMDEVHSASAEITSHCQAFAILMSLYYGNNLLLNQEN